MSTSIPSGLTTLPGFSGLREPRRPTTGTTPADGAVAPPATQTETPTPTTAEAAPIVPAGVDPELWSVLSPEERAYFARSRELGPLTYGRRSRNSPPPGPRLGGRIDVRI